IDPRPCDPGETRVRDRDARGIGRVCETHDRHNLSFGSPALRRHPQRNKDEERQQSTAHWVSSVLFPPWTRRPACRMVDRSATSWGSAVMPASGSGPSRPSRIVLYASVGPVLTQYDVDVDSAALVKHGAV